MSDFTDLVGRLWTELGLGQPRFEADGRTISLEVDDRRLMLELSPDERHVVVHGRLPSLSGDRPVRADQMRRLLQDSLGLAVLNGAATHLVRPAGDAADGAAGEIVAVTGLAPCRAHAVADLVRSVEDVLQRLDLHAAALAGHGGARHRAMPLDLGSGDVIIRL